MIKACEHLCADNGLERTDQVYIFLDVYITPLAVPLTQPQTYSLPSLTTASPRAQFLSIPQKNLSMRLAAINTLGVFSSLAKYFVVIAPEAVHKDTGAPMNKRTYSRRGW